MNQKEFSYSRSRVLKASGDVKAKFVKNPPAWAILWAAQKGMLTEGVYSISVAINENALDLFIMDNENTNLIIGKNADSYFCTVSKEKPSVISTYDDTKWNVGCDGEVIKIPLISGVVLSKRERVVNGVTEKWHTQIR